MHRRTFLQSSAALALGLGAQASTPKTIPTPGAPCDVFVYGSTPGGLAAAIEAARRGEKVVLACPKRHVGGMAASGLCTTDAVRRHLFGGLVHEFIARVRRHYLDTLGENHPEWPLCKEGWFYEPSVAERCFQDMIEAEENITWLPEHWLSEVMVEGRRIRQVILDTPKGGSLAFTARSYIDCTYEGDLAAKAGVDYRVARESREEFGETKAGIHYMNWRTGEIFETPQSGEASIGIQAYCARSIITDDKTHRIPIEKPASYEQHLQDYLPLIQDFKSGRVKKMTQAFPARRMPNGRYESNGIIEALTSPNCPGVSWAWPDADRAMRLRLEQFHIEHAAGLLYFLQHDSHVPARIRMEAKRFGLHAQEFKDSQHWPWQIYVRQARRIKGRALITQHNFTPDPKIGRTPPVENPIALGEHSFDVHPCHDRRWMHQGFMEGVLWYPKKAEGPAQPGQIPYGALLPKKLDNLLVPVAMSSTHVAMSVLRMEPVWMTTGQIAGLACVVAKEQRVEVGEIDPTSLSRTLKIKTEPA